MKLTQRAPTTRSGTLPNPWRASADHRPEVRRLLHLQSVYGNAAVQRLLEVQRQTDDDAVEEVVPAPPLTVDGEPEEVTYEGGCDDLSLHGQATGTFNGGHASVQKQKVTTTGPCDQCPEGTKCLHMTGTMVTKYSVSVKITMPPVPAGLTPCETKKVKAFLTNVLLPHEKEHERRLKTYNGTTSNPVDLTGCSLQDLHNQAAAIQAAEDIARKGAAQALSDLADPFNEVVDCGDCDD